MFDFSQIQKIPLLKDIRSKIHYTWRKLTVQLKGKLLQDFPRTSRWSLVLTWKKRQKMGELIKEDMLGKVSSDKIFAL